MALLKLYIGYYTFSSWECCTGIVLNFFAIALRLVVAFLLRVDDFTSRYLILLYATIYSLRSKRFAKDKNWVYRRESDICMLHLFGSFMGAAPQLILQLYVMAVLHRTPLWTSKEN